MLQFTASQKQGREKRAHKRDQLRKLGVKIKQPKMPYKVLLQTRKVVARKERKQFALDAQTLGYEEAVKARKGKKLKATSESLDDHVNQMKGNRRGGADEDTNFRPDVGHFSTDGLLVLSKRDVEKIQNPGFEQKKSVEQDEAPKRRKGKAGFGKSSKAKTKRKGKKSR